MTTVTITLEEYEILKQMKKDLYKINNDYIVTDDRKYMSKRKVIKEIKKELSKEYKELKDLEQKLNESILRDMVKQDELEKMLKKDKKDFIISWVVLVAIITSLIILF
jgi:hypothetical protein